MRIAALVAAVALGVTLASPAFAEDPSAPVVRSKPPWGALTDTVGAAEIILRQLCLPAIVEQRPVSDLAYALWLVASPPKSAGAAASDRVWRLASINPVYAVAWSDGSCSTFVDRGPADKLRAMADLVIRARPEQFRLESTTPLEGGTVKRSVYCGGSSVARYAVTITTPTDRPRRGTRALASTVYKASADGFCSSDTAPLSPSDQSSGSGQGKGLHLVRPAGVGGCVFRKLPEAVNRAALEAVMAHGDIGRVLREPVASVWPRCTGLPYSASDAALVGSVFSLYMRMVAATSLESQINIPQRQLDSAWSAATPEEKAPYLAGARSFLAADRTVATAKLDAVAPLQQRLGPPAESLDPRILQIMHSYYSATALSELAEIDLASRGASAMMDK